MGQTLIRAVEEKNLPRVQKLLAKGIDVNKADQRGWTALTLAAKEGHVEIVRALLATPGIDVNVKLSRSGMTALMFAATFDRPEVVQELLNRGANVNEVDNEGRTALMWAATMGHAEVVRALLATPGINVNAKNNQGRTARDLAKKDEIKQLLVVLVDGVKEIEEENSIKDDNCAICQEKLKKDPKDPSDNGPVVQTTCGHQFHKNCLKNLKSRNDVKCPICRDENTFFGKRRSRKRRSRKRRSRSRSKRHSQKNV
jgi:ankyrin repeat protein